MACLCQYRKLLLKARHDYFERSSAYFDYNAATPVDIRVIGEMEKVERTLWQNPSSLHTPGTKVWEFIENAKNRLGKVFCVDADGFSFCGSATEALSLLINTVVNENSLLFCTTGIEHSGIYKKARVYKMAGKNVRFIPLTKNGYADLEELKKNCASGNVFFLYSPVNHETGAVQPVKDIFNIVNDSGGIVAIDAAQCAYRMKELDWSKYCSAFVFCGHKIYGPKGVASLWTDPKSEGLAIKRVRRKLPEGTPNTPGVAGLALAAELTKKSKNDELLRINILMKEGLEILKAGPPFEINSPINAAPGVCNISLPWVNDMGKLMLELDRKQIVISRYAACSRDIQTPSRILLAMGKGFKNSLTSLRICLGRDSRRSDFFLLKDKLISLHNEGI